MDFCRRRIKFRRLVAALDAPARRTRTAGAGNRALRDGLIVAVKGIGGYHLACTADDAAAVTALRGRKYRKERAFAVMVRDAAVAEQTVHLTADARELLQSAARPIVLSRA